MRRHHSAITVLQATEEAPTLGKLAALARESQERLHAIEPLLPGALRSSLTPGPIEGNCWCLLVRSNAAAAKVRNLIPSLIAELNRRGWMVKEIRLKTQANHDFAP